MAHTPKYAYPTGIAAPGRSVCCLGRPLAAGLRSFIGNSYPSQKLADPLALLGCSSHSQVISKAFLVLRGSSGRRIDLGYPLPFILLVLKFMIYISLPLLTWLHLKPLTSWASSEILPAITRTGSNLSSACARTWPLQEICRPSPEPPAISLLLSESMAPILEIFKAEDQVFAGFINTWGRAPADSFFQILGPSTTLV
jgi:hypothetical protein